MDKIFVTRPLLPPLDAYNQQIKEIFDSQWLTNMGTKHNLLESQLRTVLKVPHLSLFNNGTIALLVALKALDLPYGSEVITTPFTFAATPHCIVWNGCKPVFCDIEPNTMTIDADKIERLITPNTSAILGVHVYGFPCNVEKIASIAKKYNLKVIYDAAHAFSTEINGQGIGTFGDITMFSFHATKLFNTIEGGCLTYNATYLERKIYNLRNFGIQSEEVVEDVGINGKMNEFQAAMGLLNLNIFREEQHKRSYVKSFYDERLGGGRIPGIRVPQIPSGTTNSFQYYPIVIENNYPINRDELYVRFKSLNILTRKYFYPACHDYICYKTLSHLDNLAVVDDIKHKVLCLPFYGSLSQENLTFICDFINKQNRNQ